MHRTRAATVLWMIVTIVPIAGLVYSVVNPGDYQAVRSAWSGRILAWGALAPLAFVLLQVAQVVLFPLSHYTVGALGGFVFGPFLGGVLNWIGRVIGHCIAYLIAHRYGRRVITRFVDERSLAQFDRLIGGTGRVPLQSLLLFLIYFLPFFPDDEVSYVVGLSRMPFRAFLIANLIGHWGGALSLAYLGSGVDTRQPYFWILTVLTLLGFPAIWLILRRASHRSG